MIEIDLIGLLAILGAISFGIYKLSSSYIIGRKAQQFIYEDIKKALISNKKYDLQNCIVLYKNKIDQETLKAIEQRIRDLEIEEVIK